MRLFLVFWMLGWFLCFSPAWAKPAHFYAPAVVYRLVVKEAGRYACYPCRAFGKDQMYLAEGEVWKYGVTNDPEGRYDPGDYEERHFRMEVLLRFETRRPALWTEYLLIRLYPYGLRNLRRKHPLPMPPGHKIRR